MRPDPIAGRGTQLAILAGPRLSAARALLESAGLPSEDLTERHCEHFFYAGSADAPTALVGLEIFREVALLRSLAVAADQRGSGLGAVMLAHAEKAARDAGVKALFLLTTTAEAFFAKRGYERVPRDSAPSSIRNTREFSGICPASSAFMKRTL